jgi:hypothetical protein
VRALAGVLLLLTSACTIGPRPGEYAPDATGPHGVFGTLTMRGGGEVRVELIEVRDTSLVVLGPEGYALAHFDRIRAIDMPPHYRSSQFSALRARARLRPASRFPHGIPPGVLDELLRSANQTALTVLAARR